MKCLPLLVVLNCVALSGAASAQAGRPEPVAFASPTLDFSYRPSLLGAASATVVPACPFDARVGDPTGAAPEHAAIVFAGARPVAPDETLACNLPGFEQAQLRVFPLARYAGAHPGIGKSLAELEGFLRRGAVPGAMGPTATVPAETALPFVPYVDAFPAFTERLDFLPFANGRGVGFLTQWMTEPDTLGDRLVYVFQGLDNAGTRYVLGLFPVRARRALPGFPFRPGETVGELFARYRAYAQGVAQTLREARDAEFDPDLEGLREMLRSLRVK